MSESTHVVPQWQPPSHLADPYVRRERVKRSVWTTASRGRIPGGTTQAVAWRLSEYGNRGGENCHPGARRLARDVRASEKSVRRALAWLTAAGWVSCTFHGNRKLEQANVYRVTIPAPVSADMGRWTEEMGDQWMERPEGVPWGDDVADAGPLPCPPIPEARRSDRIDKSVRSGAIPDGSSPIPVTGDRPPGESHPVLNTPLRDSITASHASARRDGDDPIDDDVMDRVTEEIGATIGGPMSYDVAAMVDGMLCRDADPRMIVRVAVARERNPA